MHDTALYQYLLSLQSAVDREPCELGRQRATHSRMLKKSASIVLASLKGSTRVSRKSEALEGLFRSPRSIARANGPTKCGPYLLASSLAVALLDGLFEHPGAIVPSTP